MTKNFVNLHILISHSPSCLNRDDMNMQKTAVFGGARRVRVSSQSLKRAIRKSDYYVKHLGGSSSRTRSLGVLKEALVRSFEGKVPSEIIDKSICFWADVRNLEEFNSEGVPVAPWVEAEILFLCEELQRDPKFLAICDEFLAITGNGDADKKRKSALAKATEKYLKDKKRWEGLNKALESGVDVALSGRMATSGLMTTVDGAMAVAHAITTHAAEADIDWFTAVDDLQELGSGHLDTQEFSSGVFYRYASINLRQLQDNLGGASRERALEIAAHALHLLATVVPSAKQQSFAAHNLSDFAMVSLADQPISLANAFESPVKKQSGFLKPSVEALLNYWSKVHRGYGLEEHIAAFDMSDTDSDVLKMDNLPALEQWIRNDGK